MGFVIKMKMVLQGNEIWDEGEGVEGNNQYDSNESFMNFIMIGV